MNEGEIRMDATITRNNTMDMTGTNSESLLARVKRYFIENVDFFTAGAAMVTGNAGAAVEIMRASRR